MVCCAGQNELNLTKPAVNVEKKLSSGKRSGEGSIVYQPKMANSSPLNSQPVFASQDGSKNSRSRKEMCSSPRQRSKLINIDKIEQEEVLKKSEPAKEGESKPKSPIMMKRQGTLLSNYQSQEIIASKNNEEEKPYNAFE